MNRPMRSVEERMFLMTTRGGRSAVDLYFPHAEEGEYIKRRIFTKMMKGKRMTKVGRNRYTMKPKRMKLN